MRNANMIWALSCALAVATACSSSSSPNNAADSGSDAGTGDDSTTTPVGDDGSGPPMMMAMITCMGPADCGGAGHSCCFSMMTFSTMCRTGTCGMDYTQCAGSDSDCPAGMVCVPSPLGMNVHYCVAGDGGGTSDGATTAESGAPDSGTDASGDGPSE